MEFGAAILGIFLKALWYIIDSISDIFFGLYYKGRNIPLPPITNPILIQSGQSLAAQIRNRKLKSREVVQAFIDRIKEVNEILNAAVDHRYDEALEEADKVDEFIATGKKTAEQLAVEKPFLGLPFTIKDSFAIKGLRQTVGMVRRKNQVAEEDAEVIKLMKEAGAIPLAVTNVPELCFWMDAANNVYGKTRNPYDSTRLVGGSSGGEGSIVASAASVLGIGADIAGSIRNPSCMTGIFGHKPSAVSVPLEGQLVPLMVELSEFNTTGPMCRFASDLLPMYKVLAKPNLHKMKLDTKVDIRKIKYFYMTDDNGSYFSSSVDPEITAAQMKIVQYLERNYGIKAEKVVIQNLKYTLQIWAKVIGKHSSVTACQEVNERQGEMNPVGELFKSLFKSSNHTLPMIFYCLWEKFFSHTVSDDYVQMAEDLKQEFQRLLGDDGVFIYPTFPRLAPYHNQLLLPPHNFFTYTCGFNILGFPSTQCPLGLSSNGLPLGIQVVATRYNDHLTLAVAQELEKAFGGWVPPCPVTLKV